MAAHAKQILLNVLLEAECLTATKQLVTYKKVKNSAKHNIIKKKQIKLSIKDFLKNGLR